MGGNFTCNGLESTIHDCSYDASPDCGHHQDAGVYCNVKCGDGDVRMVNSSSEYQGRVEVCMNGTWHPVCDSLWTTEDAIVVCRQLGYSTLGKMVIKNLPVFKITILGTKEPVIIIITKN